MKLELDVLIKPRSLGSPEPFISTHFEMTRNGKRCDCGKIYAIHYRPQDELKGFLAALKMAVADAKMEQGIIRPLVGNISLQVIVYRPRPLSHYHREERSQGLKNGRDDSLPMVLPQLHLIQAAIISSLNGELFTDKRQLSVLSIKDVWGDEDRLQILARQVTTADVDDRFKEQDLGLFNLQC